MLHIKRTLNKGFTLAEVLITLGIIGIVAAMTLPALTANYRKQVVVTRLQKFYTVFNQAIKMSELANGELDTWDMMGDGSYNTPEGSVKFFNKYLKSYIKTLKTEYYYDSKAPLGGVKMYFSDGSAALYGSQHVLFYPVASIDNGIDGKDTFYFALDTKKKMLLPYGQHNVLQIRDREDLMNNSTFGCARSSNKNRRFCAALIMYDGWKISDDYPVKI